MPKVVIEIAPTVPMSDLETFFDNLRSEPWFECWIRLEDDNGKVLLEVEG